MATEAPVIPQLGDPPDGVLEERKDACRVALLGEHASNVKAALVAVASGINVRQACIAHDADPFHVWKLARRYKIVDTTSSALRDRTARVGHLSAEELEKALLDGKLDLGDPKAVAAIAKILDTSLRSIAALDKAGGGELGSTLGDACARLLQALPPGAGATFSFRVERDRQGEAFVAPGASQDVLEGVSDAVLANPAESQGLAPASKAEPGV